MKILLIGAQGTIGKGIYSVLKDKHEIITAGRSSGDIQVDLSDAASIKNTFEVTGKVDAIISAAGLSLAFKPLTDMTPEDYQTSFNSKGLGQIQLAIIGKDYLNDGGSITLTSGILNTYFIASGSAAAMVNSAIEGFAKAAACEMPRGIRINVVSPTLLTESIPTYGDFFPGAETVSSEKVARAFVRSTLGIETGKVFSVI
jgi:NAD(P)-dependent dehydrogenase (short-subunit alcohol dehydrogenase family)